MMKTFLTILAYLLVIMGLGLGLYAIFENFRSTNKISETQVPSSNVSPRLKGIFKGLGEGFSN